MSVDRFPSPPIVQVSATSMTCTKMAYNQNSAVAPIAVNCRKFREMSGFFTRRIGRFTQPMPASASGHFLTLSIPLLSGCIGAHSERKHQLPERISQFAVL
jgi:hypothetical protein